MNKQEDKSRDYWESVFWSARYASHACPQVTCLKAEATVCFFFERRDLFDHKRVEVAATSFEIVLLNRVVARLTLTPLLPHNQQLLA